MKKSELKQIIREELDKISAQELLLPALHPKSYWEKTGRWDSLDVLYKFTSYYTGTELALGSTHEEIITPIATNFIQSYQDLHQFLEDYLMFDFFENNAQLDL